MKSKPSQKFARLHLPALFYCGSLFAILTAPVLAQDKLSAPSEAMFPFVMPWDDATKGVVTDLSYLNPKPAGVNGNIVVRNGHFAESKTGQRVRLLGMNFTFMDNFPEHADATKLAAHLAKMGFNIVRIHHHDFNDSPLWDKTAGSHQKLNNAGLDKLDFLITELKKNGIYTNLNLHVSRQFTTEDGFPESVNKLPEHFSKRVDRFDQRMIELQKQFARDYLTHVNPYTKLSYAQDPCVAVVEINNENSMVGWSPSGAFYEKLPEPFRSDLIAKWNEWLAKKYGSDAALQVAWLQSVPTLPPSTLGQAPYTAQTKWFFESRIPAATFAAQEVAGQSFPDVQIFSPEVAAETFHLQPQINALNFEEGKLYSVSFRAKADKERIIHVQSSVTGGDWHIIGLMAVAPLTTEWREYRYTFRASKPLENLNRVMFGMGNDTGNVWLSNVRIEATDKPQALQSFQSLKAKNYNLPSGTIAQESADWTQFLAETERAYSDEMRRFLRDDLKVRANLTDSQMSYGGISSFNRETGSDFIDEHAYWEHPTFGGASWDPNNWTIKQRSMVDSLSQAPQIELMAMAMNRVGNKPYAMSEFCIPAPNDFQAEMFPFISSYAALQDWDALYHFDYGAYGDSQKVPRIQGFFSFAGNPAREGFIAASALLFRTGKIAPFQNVTTLKLAKDATYRSNLIREEWMAGNQKKYTDPLTSRLQVVVDSSISKSKVVKEPAKASETSTLRLIKSPEGGHYIAEGQGGLAIAGFVGGQTVQTQNAQFNFPTFGNNYAALILTSLQDPPLATARRLLLSVGGKVENLNMGWNATRTSVSNNWGQGPAHAEGIPVTISLTNPRLKHVWALDPTGARTREVPVSVKDKKASFTIGPQYRTLLYEIGE